MLTEICGEASSTVFVKRTQGVLYAHVSSDDKVVNLLLFLYAHDNGVKSKRILGRVNAETRYLRTSFFSKLLRKP